MSSKPFIAALPKYDVSLHLTHNPHKGYYESVEAYEKWRDFEPEDWAGGQSDRAAAIDTQDFWELMWYPDTPSGSYILVAHDLDLLLEVARSVES